MGKAPSRFLALLAVIIGLAVAAAPASAQFNAVVKGTVTDGLNGIFNVAVQVYDSNNSQVSSGSVFTDATGKYTAFITDFLPSPDNLTVRFGGPFGQNWADEWYDGSLTAQGAKSFPVSSGQTVINIGAILVQRGGIAGKTAQPGTAVTLYNANGSLTGMAVASASDGSYSFSGVQPGTSYKLCFEHSCYNGKPAAPAGLAGADLIPVSAGGVTVNINEQQTAVTHTLTVAAGGAGSGSVAGSGISCPGTCSHGYTAGTSVSLTAAPASGSSFTGWSGACTGAATCNVTMSADQTVTATFTPLRTLTITRSGSGSGSVSGSGIACPGTCSVSDPGGTTVSLTATPASGSVFSGWSGGCSGTGNCVVTLSSNQAIAAAFAPSGPSAAQIKTLLLSQIVPGGKAAKINALLHAGGFVYTFKAPEAGTANVAWYQVPHGAHVTSRRSTAKPVLIASGRLTFTGARTAKLKVKLTAAGKQQLKHARHLKLTAKSTFTPVGKPAIAVTRTFTLGS